MHYELYFMGKRVAGHAAIKATPENGLKSDIDVEGRTPEELISVIETAQGHFHLHGQAILLDKDAVESGKDPHGDGFELGDPKDHDWKIVEVLDDGTSNAIWFHKGASPPPPLVHHKYKHMTETAWRERNPELASMLDAAHKVLEEHEAKHGPVQVGHLEEGSELHGAVKLLCKQGRRPLSLHPHHASKLVLSD